MSSTVGRVTPAAGNCPGGTASTLSDVAPGPWLAGFVLKLAGLWFTISGEISFVPWTGPALLILAY